MSDPFLIVGLGNPGSEYEKTRHNLGFLVLDALAQRLGTSFTKKFRGEFAQTTIGESKVLLLKPLTYMNLSGQSVGDAASFFKLKPERICVVYDEMDFEAGVMKIRASGGAGGHNGMRSIIETLGGEGFPRIRMGIGRPKVEGREHVLAKIPKKEMALYEETIKLACDALEAMVKEGVAKSMNLFNTKKEVTSGT